MLRGLLVTILLVSVGLFMIAPSTAHAQIPFGGAILFMVTCNASVWIGIGPPTPMGLMYVPGSISYLNGPPLHPGQWLLGMAGPPVPCVVGPFTIAVAPVILFHGSSI